MTATARREMLYLSPLCFICASPSVHFNSRHDRCSAQIIVHSGRGTAYPAYLPSSHSHCLLGQVSCLTPKEMINRERPSNYHWASSQTLKLTNLCPFSFSPQAMCDRGPELKFSSINNIHSLSFTISKQWESGMNALDIADIQLWWTEWRLSTHNAFALPYWVVYFWLIVCCQASKLLKWSNKQEAILLRASKTVPQYVFIQLK